jgi:putative membrane protein
MTYPRSARAALAFSMATVAVLGATACAPSDPAPAAAPQPARSAAPASAVTDADIAAIVVAANTIDAQMGELALSRSSNPEVRQFAQQMVTDHNAVNQAAVDLVTKLGVTPTENPTSRGLKASAEQTRERLSALSGAEFDRAYIANEVAYHQAVLDAVDNVLIPSARNAELKATLVSVRPAFVAHLQHAQQVQASLGDR